MTPIQALLLVAFTCGAIFGAVWGIYWEAKRGEDRRKSFHLNVREFHEKNRRKN